MLKFCSEVAPPERCRWRNSC